jgi:uncharacterized protein
MKSQRQPDPVRGTPLDEKALRHGKTFSVTYAPKLRYAWDTGQAIGRYLAELKEGRLVGRACRKCERIMIPPRMFCERCFRPTDEWVYVKDTGKILTFSLCYVSWDVKRLKQPEIPAVIEVDGASRGMGILHVVKKIPPEKVRIGMALRAVWKPKAKRIGSVTDIAYWEPIKN